MNSNGGMITIPPKYVSTNMSPHNLLWSGPLCFVDGGTVTLGKDLVVPKQSICCFFTQSVRYLSFRSMQSDVMNQMRR